MEFDRNYLDQEIFVQRRLRRDAALRDLGVDPEAFRVWQRDQEVGNETDSDEYRETQPAKGLHYIAAFLDDFAPGQAACEEVIRMTMGWLGVVDDAHTNKVEWNNRIGWYAYGGAEELAPILEICFDFMWEQGGFSLYTSIDELPDKGDIEYYESPLAEGG